MFDPRVVAIEAGTTVRWTNLDAAGHTVTSGPSDEPDGLFDSGALEQGDAFGYQFVEPGTYEFYCDFHPRMTGRVQVAP
ncbi:MAG: plastocyanin/azurin family copper-binding protein [Chloroflexota bacterium]|nr:plastocyanin/azurin family copper-binding protein [Chloroflexota bacterium]